MLIKTETLIKLKLRPYEYQIGGYISMRSKDINVHVCELHEGKFSSLYKY